MRGIHLRQQDDNTNNSSRLFFDNSTNIWTAYSTNGFFKIASGATIGTSSETDRLVIDSSGNVGIGVTPDAANGSFLQFANGYAMHQNGISRNTYYDGTSYKAIYTGGATLIQGGDDYLFYTAPSVFADANQTFSEVMRITNGRAGS